MNTFNRYLTHFFGISMIIYCMMLILMGIDDGIKVASWMVWGGFFLVLFYVIPMTLFFYNQAKSVQVSIINQKENNTIVQLENIITHKFERPVKEVKGNEMIYKRKGKYAQWLTNPVKVIPYGERIILILPKGYKQEIVSRYIIDK